MRFIKTLSRQDGQTLVDLMIALALAASAVASAGYLATTSARVNTEAGRRSQATALADREIEALRDYRTAGEKSGTSWAGIWPGLTAGGCITAYMQRNGNTWQLVAAGPTKYSATNAGESGSPNAAQFDTEYSTFSRSDQLCDVSSQLSTSNTVSVTVTETWKEQNGNRQVIERTLLTDWNP